MVWLQDDRKPFFFIDIFFFHVHSTVSFFSKLVIPVHVSMEEPVFKTKVEKSKYNCKCTSGWKGDNCEQNFTGTH